MISLSRHTVHAFRLHVHKQVAAYSSNSRQTKTNTKGVLQRTTFPSIDVDATPHYELTCQMVWRVFWDPWIKQPLCCLLVVKKNAKLGPQSRLCTPVPFRCTYFFSFWIFSSFFSCPINCTTVLRSYGRYNFNPNFYWKKSFPIPPYN